MLPDKLLSILSLCEVFDTFATLPNGDQIVVA